MARGRVPTDKLIRMAVAEANKASGKKKKRKSSKKKMYAAPKKRKKAQADDAMGVIRKFKRIKHAVDDAIGGSENGGVRTAAVRVISETPNPRLRVVSSDY